MLEHLHQIVENLAASLRVQVTFAFFDLVEDHATKTIFLTVAWRGGTRWAGRRRRARFAVHRRVGIHGNGAAIAGCHAICLENHRP